MIITIFKYMWKWTASVKQSHSFFPRTNEKKNIKNWKKKNRPFHIHTHSSRGHAHASQNMESTLLAHFASNFFFLLFFYKFFRVKHFGCLTARFCFDLLSTWLPVRSVDTFDDTQCARWIRPVINRNTRINPEHIQYKYKFTEWTNSQFDTHVFFYLLHDAVVYI